VAALADPVDNLPLWPIIALADRLNSRGRAVFHQEQVTKDIRIFRIHKLRARQTDDRACDGTEPVYKFESAKEAFRLDLFHVENWPRAAVLYIVLTRCGASHMAGSAVMQWSCDRVPS
jgi:arginine repressor